MMVDYCNEDGLKFQFIFGMFGIESRKPALLTMISPPEKSNAIVFAGS
jgi:hypothetical protein